MATPTLEELLRDRAPLECASIVGHLVLAAGALGELPPIARGHLDRFLSVAGLNEAEGLAERQAKVERFFGHHPVPADVVAMLEDLELEDVAAQEARGAQAARTLSSDQRATAEARAAEQRRRRAATQLGVTPEVLRRDLADVLNAALAWSGETAASRGAAIAQGPQVKEQLRALLEALRARPQRP